MKQIAAVAMVASVVAVWTPQLLEQMKAVPPGGPEPADFDPMDTLLPSNDSEPTFSAQPKQSSSGESETASVESKTGLTNSALDSLSDMMRLLRGTGQPVESTPWPSSTKQPQEQPATKPAIDFAPNQSASYSNNELKDRVANFLDTHLLRATLLSKSNPNGGTAIWGGRLVSPGDTFVDGEIRVDAIRKGSISLTVLGRAREVVLPDFQVIPTNSSNVGSEFQIPSDDDTVDPLEAADEIAGA